MHVSGHAVVSLREKAQLSKQAKDLYYSVEICIIAELCSVFIVALCARIVVTSVVLQC